MANFYVTQFSKTLRDADGAKTDILGPIVGHERITFTPGTSAPITTAFAAGTAFVRLIADAAGTIVFGTAPVATADNGPLLPANVVEYYQVRPGDKVAIR